MAVATVKYLLQQGYAPGQLVVLTPYLGQLLEIHRAMRAETQVHTRMHTRSHSPARACAQLGLISLTFSLPGMHLLTQSLTRVLAHPCRTLL